LIPKFFIAALLCALALPLRSPALVERPAQIILIRHAEKPADKSNPHLSPAGERRAGWLVSFITKDSAMTRLGLPVAIFATRTTSDDNGQRTQETVAPLAKGNCHTFRDLTVADSGQLRVEFVPQFVAVIAPFLVSWTTVPVTVEERPFRPEPEMEPSSHLALMRLAGRAPPALV